MNKKPNERLVIYMSEGLKRRVRAKAALEGKTTSKAVARLLKAWVDGRTRYKVV